MATRLLARLRGESFDAGQRIERVRARGKHLLMETSAGVTLHTHLEMDGRWRLCRPGERPRGPAHEVRVVLETEPWTAVGSLLPVVELWPTDEEPRRLGHLGPDVLGPDWDPDEVLRRLVADPAREVGVALIDQRVMAGPGNVYKSEALFLRGLDPRTSAGAVSDPQALIALVKRLMEANRDRAPRVTTREVRPGRALWVYGRAGRPCRRCGTPVERIAQGEVPTDRVTFLCPSCQPRGAA
jgi:endonuclease-8